MTLQDVRMVGNSFIAQPGIEKFNIKKTFKLGGGCLVAGDVIKITDARIDIDTMTYGTDTILHRLSSSFFHNNQYFKRA